MVIKKGFDDGISRVLIGKRKGSHAAGLYALQTLSRSIRQTPVDGQSVIVSASFISPF